jgi:hypothetical protein
VEPLAHRHRSRGAHQRALRGDPGNVARPRDRAPRLDTRHDRRRRRDRLLDLAPRASEPDPPQLPGPGGANTPPWPRAELALPLAPS